MDILKYELEINPYLEKDGMNPGAPPKLPKRVPLSQIHSQYKAFRIIKPTNRLRDYNQGGVEFKPTIPGKLNTVMDEERNTPRVSIAPTIYHAMAGVAGVAPRSDDYGDDPQPDYSLANLINSSGVKFDGWHVFGAKELPQGHVSNEQLHEKVPDSQWTQEEWATSPYKMEYLGRLRMPWDKFAQQGRENEQLREEGFYDEPMDFGDDDPGILLHRVPFKKGNLSMEECAIAATAMGDSEHIQMTYFDAAKYLANGGDLSLDAVRKSLAKHEDDFEAAALSAYGLAINDRNRESVRILTSANCFSKSEMAPEIREPIELRIISFCNDGAETAQMVQRAFDNGYYNRVNLNGKHSAGSVVAKDPKTNIPFLLKPDVSEDSPAMGMKDSINSPSERAAAFWHVANAYGLGGDMPQCDLLLVNNHQTAAMRLLPLHYKNLGLLKNTEPNLPREVLEPYRKTGQIHKWAILYWILGETDAHSSNIMYSKEDQRCILIDHGASMAGVNFNPAFDENSYIPFFLRAFAGNKFKTMSPVERANVMPRCPDTIEPLLEQWVESLSSQKIAAVLRRYEIDATPMLARLNQIKNAPRPLWQSINRLWAGVGV